MTALLPGFRDQLEIRATELAREDADWLASEESTLLAALEADGELPSPGADEDADRVPVYVPHAGRGDRGPRPKRRRRLHGRGLALAIVASLLGASGVAVAAQQILWSPPLGNERSGRAKASATEVPADMLRAFAVMRRPQTDVDRGAGSRFALTMNGKGSVIRTNGVRRLATGLGGGAIVLVPFERQEGGLMAALRKTSRDGPLKPGEKLPTVVVRDQVCVSYLDGYTGAGVACEGLDGLLKGKLSLGLGFDACVTPESRRNFARMQAQERQLAADEGRSPVETTCSRRKGDMQQFTFGLVPDGVAAVKFSRSPNGVELPVSSNVWQSAGGGAFGPKVWLDADGNELSKKLADTKARLGIKG
ncbi:MAG: hypothetical protein Q7T55_10190 [Solirubrobacteraceae bacterium]|nr:hypothetical protein [Solirubrobacteraceae bacterium]